MTNQLTPAEELRVFDKAVDILSIEVAEHNLHLECPDPSKFNPEGLCRIPSKELCAKCFREWAVNKVMQEMEASK